MPSRAQYPQKDSIFGLDRILSSGKARTVGTSLTLSKHEHSLHGKTHKGRLFGTRYIVTSQSANIKHINAVEFEKFGVEPLRLTAHESDIGVGIFNTDGSKWEHSKALLRPAFATQQIANVAKLE